MQVIRQGCGGTSDRKSGGRWTRGLLCIAFQRLFQSSVTRLGLRLIRSGGHSPRVFQTLHNLSDTVSWTITMLSPPKAFKKKRIYRSTLCFSLPPSSSIFHASISQILLCNKAEIKRLVGQLKYNESWREPFASGVVGLQRMWYLETMRSGFIGSGPYRLARLPYGLPAGDAGCFLTAYTTFLMCLSIILWSDLMVEGHVGSW